jgi:tRNA(Ile)-lysidine synthase
MKRKPAVREIVRDFIERKQLFRPGETILAALSGGADSLCLVLVLQELGYPLRIAHFDHRLRPDSGRDAEFVRRAADRLGIPVRVGQGDVAGFAAGKKLTIEEAARKLRYDFLRRTAEELSIASIATGHTLDDQAETVLLHVIRGSGVNGLAGIRPASPGPTCRSGPIRVVRPLLGLNHSQTQEYCRRSGWTALEDSSNADPAFARNRIRSRLLPELETFNPGVRAGLARLADIAGSQADFIAGAADEIWERTAQSDPRLVRIPQATFLSVHVALRRELVRRVVRHLRGELEDLAGRHVDQVTDFADSPPRSGRMDWALGITVSLERGWIVFTSVRKDSPSEEWDGRELPVPGILALRDPEWTIRLSLVERDEKTDDPWTVRIPAHKIRFPLSLRRRRNGDRFHPRGMAGAVRLSDFLSAQHLPFRERGHWPLVCDADGILWIPGIRVREGLSQSEGLGKNVRIQVDRQ